jgi:hypothetical protein
MLLSASAYGADASYEEITETIAATMSRSLSVARKESYSSIKFDKCTFEYTVSGTYPVGDLYTIKFSGMDFTGFNLTNSKTGYDYTSFIILNFDRPFIYKSGIKDIKVQTTVVNVANDDDAQTLFKAFSLLGELCGANSPGSGEVRSSP